MSCGIYKITNLVNGKSYIGQSIDINRRWRNEKSSAFNIDSNGYNSLLSQAFRKYGIDNFSFEILEECAVSELNEKEIYYISFYNSYFQGYNATTGGQGTMNGVSKISKEQLLKIYDLLLNSKISQNDIALEFGVGVDVISTINQGKSRRLDGYTYPLRNNGKLNLCCDCGKPLTSNKTVRCKSCHDFHIRKAIRPSKEELFQELQKEKGNFAQVGRNHGVVGNTIRKWCRSYDLPDKSGDYKPPKQEKQLPTLPKPVVQLDLKSGEILNEFLSLTSAGEYISKIGASSDTVKHIGSRIGQVCNGNRLTAYGFKWKFL